MPDKDITTCLNEWFVRLNQSINVEYLAIVDGSGNITLSAGELGLINREDAEMLLKSYFNHPDHMYLPESIASVRIIKKGTIECFITPIDGTVQLLAITSIERPSVLIRLMLTEVQTAGDEITAIVKNGEQASNSRTKKETEVKKRETTTKGTIVNQTENTKDALESLMEVSDRGKQIKEASKFWETATLDEQQEFDDGKSISFNEARRSGLVPDEKK